ncbi:MAG: hypothetical protein JXA78_03530 [Anaerolineales bacterium]|nr:hypothetical protein [Anaerolineales bacterium]
MNSRQRFLETMRYGAPDRVPLFREGIRDGVLESWRMQGLPPDQDLDDIFAFDVREEIDLNLDARLDLFELSGLQDGLERLRSSLASEDPARLPEGWPERLPAWQQRQQALMLQVHDGFFLCLGVGDWRSFARAMYLLVDHPEFVRQAMLIFGEASARLAEKLLRQVPIDAAVFSEPIGGLHGPLVSPETYGRFVLPSYKPILDVLERYGVEAIIFRTYANTRLLLPKVIESGFNCLWAVECNPQAMDYLSLRKEFGKHLRLVGGIDLDVLRQGEPAIRQELERVVPPLLDQGGYVPLADGRVRQDIPFEHYIYYRRLLEHLAQQ